MSTDAKRHSIRADLDTLEEFLIHAGASNTRKDALRRLEEQLDAARRLIPSLMSYALAGPTNEASRANCKKVCQDAAYWLGWPTEASSPAKEPTP